MIKFPLLKAKEQTLKEKTIAKWKAIGMLDELVPVQPMSAPNPDVYFYIQPNRPPEYINVNITISNNENTEENTGSTN